MALPLDAEFTDSDTYAGSSTLSVLDQLPSRLREYRILIAAIKGDIGAINILKDALTVSRNLGISNILLALGPTTPLSLPIPYGSRILWATFTDGTQLRNESRLTVVPPNHLTDLSLNFDKLSKIRSGRIPFLVGDFLDNVLSVSTAPAGLYSFLCKLFTRIRTNEQTAFFLVTEDMHHPTKTAILRRFADVVIEYRSTQLNSEHRIVARILDHLENYYATWDSGEHTKMGDDPREFHYAAAILDVGRQTSPLLKEPNAISS